MAGFPMVVAPELEEQVRHGFDLLRTGGELSAVEPSMTALLAAEPGYHPARVLLAQMAYLRRDNARARELLSLVASELPAYLACDLLLGRVAELEDDVETAFHAYSRIAAASSLARERAETLRPRMAEIALDRFIDALARGHLEEAELRLADLELWAVQADGTTDFRVLEARRELALADGDAEAEIAVVRELNARDPYDERWEERLADLELEIGEVRSALERYERLATTRPDDVELTEKLARARFLRRLDLLPVQVRELHGRGELDRADFATLLYWLVPAVRYAQVEDPPIATDILDHPRHEEILRVMNLDLIEVDETLHRFFPDDAMTHHLALRALLGLFALAEADFVCLDESEARALQGANRGFVCRKAASCGLIPEEADCLPGAVVSGNEAFDLFRRTLDLLGSS